MDGSKHAASGKLVPALSRRRQSHVIRRLAATAASGGRSAFSAAGSGYDALGVALDRGNQLALALGGGLLVELAGARSSVSRPVFDSALEAADRFAKRLTFFLEANTAALKSVNQLGWKMEKTAIINRILPGFPVRRRCPGNASAGRRLSWGKIAAHADPWHRILL